MAVTFASAVITAAICYGVLHVFGWYWRRRRLYKLASKFDGPPTLPLIGNAHLFIGNAEHVLKMCVKVYDDHVSPTRLWIGPDLWINISDPEQIKTICHSPKTLEKGNAFRHFSRALLSDGLVTGPVARWKLHRKLIQPTFKLTILETFVETFATQSEILTEKMERHLDGPEFEVFHMVSSCTLDIVCEAAMGVKIQAQANQNCRYVEAAQEFIAGICTRIFSFWLHSDFIFNRSQFGKEMQKHAKTIYDFTENVIQMKKKELLERSTHEDDHVVPVGESKPRKEVLLEHLLKLSSSNATLTDKAIHEEVNTMVVAGNDTTAIGNTNTMLMLASHPDIQEKAYKELYEIYGDTDVEERPVEAKDLPRMKYLECVIKESLRLFPVIPFVTRAVTDDLDIGGDLTLPKGSTAILCPLLLHRSEKYYEDPLTFNPDRFLPEEAAKRHPYSFMAFSGGPRNCIGMVYGMMAMKTLIATVLRKYILIKDDIVRPADVRLKMEIVMKTVDPVKIRIEKRKKN